MDKFEIIYWTSLLLLVHSYVLFPILIRVFKSVKSSNKQVTYCSDQTEQLPHISILLAVYNEEVVIREKIESTFRTSYPTDKIDFLIGSDACTDKTESIIESFQQEFSQIKLVRFGGRTGKPEIINSLQKQAQGSVLIITDANVFFQESTLFELVKHYKDEAVGLVGGNIKNINLKRDGISHQETEYLKGENQVKYLEGELWGAMMGTFGGVYSMRNELYEPVPSKFTVDDFYITLAVIEKGYKAILEKHAVALEDVSNNIKEEFRRKVRISQGNFQNLVRFKGFLYNPFKGSHFAFFSHKFLRWIGPFLIIIMLAMSALLYNHAVIYKVAFLGEISFLMLPFVDSCFKALKVNVKLLRFVSHFVMMNLALLKGFFRFVTGVKTNIWTPTQRFQ